MRSPPPYLLVDRIAATGDPGFIASGGVTNAPAARRARAKPHEKATSRGWPGERETRRRLLLLEEMLKNQTGVNVRQPSHHAPPFSSFAHVSQTNAVELDSGGAPAADVTATLHQVDFGSGQLFVPEGHRGVISKVSVVGTLDPASVSATDPASVVVFNLRRNGLPVQGYVDRPVDSALGFLGGIGITGSPIVFDGPTPTPIHVRSGDSVVIEGVLDAVAAGALWFGRVSTRVEGWLYPERISMDTVGGTIVD